MNYDPALIAPEPKPDFVRLMHAPRRPRTAVKPPPTPASDPQPEHRTQLLRRRRRRLPCLFKIKNVAAAINLKIGRRRGDVNVNGANLPVDN